MTDEGAQNENKRNIDVYNVYTTEESCKLPTDKDEDIIKFIRPLKRNQRKMLEQLVDEFNKLQNVEENTNKNEYRKCVAIDCEMVGIGLSSRKSLLGRVSIVNTKGECLYDKYVKPTAPVTDYRTEVSGLRPQDLMDGENFYVVKSEVSEIISGGLLVGHGVKNDLKVLSLTHPVCDIRDTSIYSKFFKLTGKTPALKLLASHFLGMKIQEGKHCSILDAQVAMKLYMRERGEWETSIKK